MMPDVQVAPKHCISGPPCTTTEKRVPGSPLGALELQNVFSKSCSGSEMTVRPNEPARSDQVGVKSITPSIVFIAMKYRQFFEQKF